MSWEAVTWAKYSRVKSQGAKALLMCLADDANANGRLYGTNARGAYWVASRDYYAEILGVSRRTVDEYFKHLVEHGHLLLIKCRKSEHKPNEYRIPVPANWDKSAAKAARKAVMNRYARTCISKQGDMREPAHRDMREPAYDSTFTLPKEEKTKAKKKKAQVEIPELLPAGLSRESIEEFIEHRAKHPKHPPVTTQGMLDRAIRDAVKAAELNGTTADDVFHAVINNGWRGVPVGHAATQPWFVSKLAGLPHDINPQQRQMQQHWQQRAVDPNFQRQLARAQAAGERVMRDRDAESAQARMDGESAYTERRERLHRAVGVGLGGERHYARNGGVGH